MKFEEIPESDLNQFRQFGDERIAQTKRFLDEKREEMRTNLKGETRDIILGNFQHICEELERISAEALAIYIREIEEIDSKLSTTENQSILRMYEKEKNHAKESFDRTIRFAENQMKQYADEHINVKKSL